MDPSGRGPNLLGTSSSSDGASIWSNPNGMLCRAVSDSSDSSSEQPAEKSNAKTSKPAIAARRALARHVKLLKKSGKMCRIPGADHKLRAVLKSCGLLDPAVASHRGSKEVPVPVFSFMFSLPSVTLLCQSGLESAYRVLIFCANSGDGHLPVHGHNHQERGLHSKLYHT